MTAKSISESVKRLRQRCNCNSDNPCGADEDCQLDREAASALESQAAEIARLRGALEPFADIAEEFAFSLEPPSDDDEIEVFFPVKALNNARAALAETPAGLDRQGPRSDAG